MNKLSNDRGSIDWPLPLALGIIALLFVVAMAFPGNGEDYKLFPETAQINSTQTITT